MTDERAAKGTVAEPGNGHADAMHRAEELVDYLGDRLGRFAKAVGFQVLHFAARAREEAEDVWAEAQSIRRGERD